MSIGAVLHYINKEDNILIKIKPTVLSTKILYGITVGVVVYCKFLYI